MKLEKIILFALLICFNFSVYSQKETGKKLRFIPYIGLNSSQGDFKNVSENGLVVGFSLDKYLSSKLALGIDLNHQTNPFKNGIDYSIIPNPSVVKAIENKSWTNTTLTFGPTYSIGNHKFNTEIYAKTGISFVKSPNSVVTVSNPTFPDFNIFDLRKQQITSFGLTSGIRFNYTINEKITFFINPQYVISGAEVGYYYKDPTVAFFPGIDGADPIFNPGLLVENPGIETVVKPAHFNLNAGIKFNLGGKKIDTQENVENSNLNPSFCRLQFVRTECNNSSTTLILSSNWSGFSTNFTQAVEVYNGNTLLNPSTANNPQTLSQNYGNQLFTIPTSVSIGTNLRAKLKIFDTNGNIVCESLINFSVPPCSVQSTCDFQVDVANVICNFGSVTYNTTSSWSNVTTGSTINIFAYANGNQIPIINVPNNLPITVNNTNNSSTAAHSVTISSSYIGQSIVLIMKITDPTTGAVKSCGGADLFLPECNNEDCEITAEAQPCNTNGKTVVNFTSNWINYLNPIGYNLNITLFDSNNTPINTFIPNNGNPIGSVAGTRTFQVDLTPYAGTTIYAILKICKNGNPKDCCEKHIKIDIPKCCIDCFDIELENTTYNTNITGNTFPITGYFNSKEVKKVAFQLEEITCNNLAGAPITNVSNIEFSKQSLINGGSGTLIGSLSTNSDRSNMIIKDLPPSTTAVNFSLLLDNFTNKKLVKYRIKVTAFFADGTYCESYLNN